MAKTGNKYAKGLLERRSVRFVLLLLGPLVVLAGAAFYYVTGGRYVTTDDAYVEADKVQISSDVTGRVVEVEVSDHQTVAKGALLFRIDDEPFKIALARAEGSSGVTHSRSMLRCASHSWGSPLEVVDMRSNANGDATPSASAGTANISASAHNGQARVRPRFTGSPPPG